MNEIVLCVEVPGVIQEDIDIEVSGDTLTFKGQKKFDDEANEKSYVRVERAYGSLQRIFSLEVPVQPDKVSASFKDGVPTVTVPKSEATKPKKVVVEAV